MLVKFAMMVKRRIHAFALMQGGAEFDGGGISGDEAETDDMSQTASACTIMPGPLVSFLRQPQQIRPDLDSTRHFGRRKK